VSKSDLKIDWATHAAAKYACENWHYSKKIPVFKCVYIGVWELGKFIGVVIFSVGANCNSGKPFGIKQTELCELTRVALNSHVTPVTRIISIAMNLLKTKCPGLRLVVSYADREQGHHGGIYQGGNWIYTGTTKGGTSQIEIDKVRHHKKTIRSKYGHNNPALIPGAKWVQPLEKHKYIMPLDDEMRKQIELLRKPYPKRVRSVDSDTATVQVAEGGANPTRTL
jgi:hypothetical protein